jgi:hypothetical protein
LFENPFKQFFHSKIGVLLDVLNDDDPTEEFNELSMDLRAQ